MKHLFTWRFWTPFIAGIGTPSMINDYVKGEYWAAIFSTILVCLMLFSYANDEKMRDDEREIKVYRRSQ